MYGDISPNDVNTAKAIKHDTTLQSGFYRGKTERNKATLYYGYYPNLRGRVSFKHWLVIFATVFYTRNGYSIKHSQTMYHCFGRQCCLGSDRVHFETGKDFVG